MTDFSRRDFVRLGALSALGLALGPPQALADGLFKDLKILRRSRLMMGTYVTLTLVDPSLDRAGQALETALAEMERLTAILTRYDKNGPLAHLARRGSLASPQPELVAVLKAAGRFHALSNGCFDATIAPVVDATRDSFARRGRPLNRAELDRLLARVDGRAVEVGPSRVRLLKEGMALTLDGLAKGYIVDRAAACLKKKGVSQALINAGGDIYALGQKGSRPWRVAVLDPTGGRPGPVISLTDRALATSGNYEVFWDQEKLHHHIVDPGSGTSPRGPVSVSVRTESCLAADALSTTLFCLKAREALPFLSRQGAEGLIVNQRGERIMRGAWG